MMPDTHLAESRNVKDLRNLAADETLGSRSRENDTFTHVLSLVFRFRYWLHILIVGGVFAISWAAAGAGVQRVWLALPEAASAHLGIDLGSAIIALTVTATLLAIAAAALRTWGTAYLGQAVVFSPNLSDGRLVIDGPYRYVRNPLYLGAMLHTVALSVLMSWMGAAFAIVAMAGLQVALIAYEERGHLHRARQDYLVYMKRVPRLIPQLLPVPPDNVVRPRWGQAIAGEIYMWGVAVSFAAFGFTYNALLIGQGVLVSLGLSVVIRGLTAKR